MLLVVHKVCKKLPRAMDPKGCDSKAAKVVAQIIHVIFDEPV
jgi:hypothetical protein